MTPEYKPPTTTTERFLRAEPNIAGHVGEAKPTASPSVLSKMLRRPSQVSFREGSPPPPAIPAGAMAGSMAGAYQRVRKPSMVRQISREKLQEHLRL